MKRQPLIGVIDYGMGNLRSVGKALERLGGRVYVGSDSTKLLKADKLVLPGVGAFGKAMEELKKRRLIDVIHRTVEKGKFLFGICLGLQLFFERSAESKSVKGLGLWKGNVVQFKSTKTKRIKVPHMGWNQVRIVNKHPLLAKVPNNSYFYFVHSFYGVPDNPKAVIGQTNYGTTFASIVGQQNVFATQFHPEKSQMIGLQILKNFIRL